MTKDAVVKEIGGLAGLDLRGLRKRWFELYDSDAPVRMSRELLIQAIAYRLQENTHGALSSVLQARLVASGELAPSTRARIERTVKPGTRFVREWQGRRIEVVAAARGGYLFGGRTYGSLSAIAREVTGTRWSGPTFFGLVGDKRGSGRGSK